MKHKEIEFKYNAENISLTDFAEFCQGLKGSPKYVEVSGFDYFYSSKADEDGFYRIRVDHKRVQLTYKHKTKDTDNYVREEHNLNFDSTMTKSYVEGYVNSLGYKFNSKIFKSCFIYIFDTYTLVYYVCYNEDMKELGRFVEIEMSEDYAWPTQQDAWNELIAMERICRPIGITPQARVKRSLFEMFGKE